MWALENHTPFSAERCWVRDTNGAEVWLVAVRATFDIFPDGMLDIAEKQEPVCMAPVYAGEPGQSSLRYESDLHHCKTATDVLLHGHAYAPQGRQVRHCDVCLTVASQSKTVRVYGDRWWQQGMAGGTSASSPEPFTTMPLTYERAFGGSAKNPEKQGWEPRNPVGLGYAASADQAYGQRLPNIEYPNQLVTSWKQRPQPAGFGPLSGTWQPRLGYAGTYDKQWQEERLPLLPEDFNEHYYQCAPADQQVPGFLKGGEPVELRNLTPQGMLRFRLPQVSLHFATRYFDGDKVSHASSLHTVIIEPDHPRLIMVWHTHLPCHVKALKLEKTVISDSGIAMPCCR